MVSRIFVLAVLCATFAWTASAQCGNQCKFRLCRLIDGTPRNKGTRVLLRAPNTSLSGVICRPGMEVTDVRSTGEAMVAEGKSMDMVPISKFSPAGLRPQFKKSFFKLFKIQFVPEEQGIGRKPTRGNQQEFLDDLCVVLPITSYDVMMGGKTKTINRSRPSDCLSFRTRNPKVLVELSWNSSDDLDLEVTEPDGELVTREAPEGDSGRLNNDNNVGACGMIPAGKEAVIYEQMLEIASGDYTATIKHFNNCGDGPTRWRLRVIVDGDVVLTKTGNSDLPKDSVAARINFSL